MDLEEETLIRAVEAEKQAHAAYERLWGLMSTCMEFLSEIDEAVQAHTEGKRGKHNMLLRGVIKTGSEMEALINLNFVEPVWPATEQEKETMKTAKGFDDIPTEYKDRMFKALEAGLDKSRAEYDAICAQYGRTDIGQLKANAEEKFIKSIIKTMVTEILGEETPVAFDKVEAGATLARMLKEKVH